jgi:hypothetical protein
MRHAIKEQVTFCREGSAASGSPIRSGEAPIRMPAPVEVPIASVAWQLPSNIAEERLDYYAWVFHLRGFSSGQMTFAQFLAVVAAVHPSRLFPGYDPSYLRAEHFV